MCISNLLKENLQFTHNDTSQSIFLIEPLRHILSKSIRFFFYLLSSVNCDQIVLANHKISHSLPNQQTTSHMTQQTMNMLGSVNCNQTIR